MRRRNSHPIIGSGCKVSASAAKPSIKMITALLEPWCSTLFQLHTALSLLQLRDSLKTTVRLWKWISPTLSTIAHCNNDTWPDEIACADKRLFYSWYLFQGIRETNTSPWVLKAHNSCFKRLSLLTFCQTKAALLFITSMRVWLAIVSSTK